MTITILSRRERQVLDCRARGFSYKEVASQLGTSIDTTRTHIKRIHEKLQTNCLIGALRNFQLAERGIKPSKKTSTRIPVLC